MHSFHTDLLLVPSGLGDVAQRVSKGVYLSCINRSACCGQIKHCVFSLFAQSVCLTFESVVCLHHLLEMKRFYGSRHLKLVTAQPPYAYNSAASLLEHNASQLTAAQEWEAEWNQAGLASRLPSEVTCKLMCFTVVFH